MNSLFLSAAAFLLLVTLLPLSPCEKWWVRVWDFPRLQLFVLAAGLVAGSALLRPPSMWIVCGAAVCCVVYHGWWILPFTPLGRKESLDAGASGSLPQIGVIAANVLMDNRKAHLLLEHVRTLRPDVFVTLESDSWWESRLDEMAAEYPHAVKCPLDNLYGMHVYSRHPLEDAAVKFLIEEGVPSIHAVIALPKGPRVGMHFLHPAPPSPSENEESSERDAELILVGREVARQGNPTIVCGDLNDVAWSATTELFRKISGLLDPRRGRGMFNTFHARWFFMRWPLDHLFHSPHFTLVHIQRLPSIGSDHFPIFVRLAFQPEKISEQSAPAPDAEDREKAEEKLKAV